jgi:hypothetical protein
MNRPLLQIHNGGAGRDDGDERLMLARRAVAKGYEEAVAILSASSVRGAHEEMPWFAAGLGDARELAGLPRVRVVEDAQQHRPA